MSQLALPPGIVDVGADRLPVLFLDRPGTLAEDPLNVAEVPMVAQDVAGGEQEELRDAHAVADGSCRHLEVVLFERVVDGHPEDLRLILADRREPLLLDGVVPSHG